MVQNPRDPTHSYHYKDSACIQIFSLPANLQTARGQKGSLQKCLCWFYLCFDGLKITVTFKRCMAHHCHTYSCPQHIRKFLQLLERSSQGINCRVLLCQPHLLLLSVTATVQNGKCMLKSNLDNDYFQSSIRRHYFCIQISAGFQWVCRKGDAFYKLSQVCLYFHHCYAVSTVHLMYAL